MRKILFFIFIINISFGQTIAPKIDSLMQKNFATNEAGAALMVVKNGKIVYKKGFGVENLATKEAITSSTNFRMASVSKQFTAFCILLLEKQGKLSFEDNLLKFFPDWNKKVGEQIKIKHLLTHSSGIWDYEELIPENQKEQLLDNDVVRLLKNKDSVYFAVGSKFLYSNSGFCILEQIVEKTSGISYVQFIKQNIFNPLSMTNTRIFEAKKIISNRAMGFAKNDKNEIVESDQSITSATKGDGCVYTSLNDYSKWANSLINNKLLNINLQLKKVNIPVQNVSILRYGLGWFHVIIGANGLELFHTGSTCGFSNVVKINPKTNSYILYFSNISENHKIYFSVERLLKKYNIDQSNYDFSKALELTQ